MGCVITLLRLSIFFRQSDVLSLLLHHLSLRTPSYLNPFPADFGMDDREMMRDASAFEEDIMHGPTESNLLLESEPGPAVLPEKSNPMEYDDFGDNPMGNSDGGMLGEGTGVVVPSRTLC